MYATVSVTSMDTRRSGGYIFDNMEKQNRNHEYTFQKGRKDINDFFLYLEVYGNADMAIFRFNEFSKNHNS